MNRARVSGGIFWWYVRGYFLFTALMTVVVAGNVYRYGAGPLRILIYFKLLTTALGLYVTHRRRHLQQAFLYNRGLESSRLLVIAALLDLLICLGATVLVYAAR